MKKQTLLAPALLLAASLTFTSCGNEPKGDSATVTEVQQPAAAAQGQSYMINTETSHVRFIGYGVGKYHPGIFHLSSGTVVLTGDQVSAGDFVININSLEILEQGDMFQNKLKPHLLSADFFDAATYGTAKFQISSVTPYTTDGKDTSVIAGANYKISGNLTLKNETKNVTFPAKVDINGNNLKAIANFYIDRREWKMTYGADKSLGDKMISEVVNIQLDIDAKK